MNPPGGFRSYLNKYIDSLGIKSQWLTADAFGILKGQTLSGTANQIELKGDPGSGSTTASLASTVSINDLKINNLIANMPIKTDVNKQLSSSLISLLSDVMGTLPIGSGGTASSAALTNNKLMVSYGNQIVEGTSSSSPSFLAATLDSTGNGALSIPNGGNIQINRNANWGALQMAPQTLNQEITMSFWDSPTGFNGIGATGSIIGRNIGGTSNSLQFFSKAAAGIIATLTDSGAFSTVGNMTAANLSGVNTGDMTLTAVGSTPNSSGASIAGQALTLQPASATQPGIVSTTTQTFSGNKTIAGTIAASNLSGTNSGDVTIGTANGLSIAGQSISLAAATTTNPGAVTTTFQSFSGLKSFTSALASTFIGLTDSSNQIAIGNSNVVYINAPTPAANRVITIPDPGVSGTTFFLTHGSQTISGTTTVAGATTFTTNPTISNTSPYLALVNTVSGGTGLTLKSSPSTTAMTIQQTSTNGDLIFDHPKFNPNAGYYFYNANTSATVPILKALADKSVTTFNNILDNGAGRMTSLDLTTTAGVFMNSHMARYYAGGASQVIAAGATVPLVFDTNTYFLPQNITANGSNNLFTVTYTGMYHVSMQIQWSAVQAAGSDSQIFFRISTAATPMWIQQATIGLALSTSGQVYLNAGATIEFCAYSGAGATISATVRKQMSISLISRI